eukprot:TRINITY_DN26447_c0_g1_i1.p1 TRINITY_DN26447_c0_g1~~TRINITY_DN26447_c0_g1_i1.p1  ORF type:complete len:362 (-),score=83.88 TRINITY_DN26447_c0_g1_i1:8-1060(-)
MAESSFDVSSLTDSHGRALCSHAVWGRRCRWGKSCSFSHDVPVDLRQSLAARGREQDKCVVSRRWASVPEVAVPPWLAELQRTPQVFEYDTARFPLREALEALLEVGGGADAGATEGRAPSLELLHELPLTGEPPRCPTLLGAFERCAGRAQLPPSWAEALQGGGAAKMEKELRRTPAYLHFLSVFDRFAAEVLAPAAGGGDDDAGGVFVQRPPTLRVHLHGQRASEGKIGMHRDSDYPGHNAAEVNFWVPMTSVEGSNSLFVESAPDRGDFAPLRLQYGQAYRFHGYACRHHTVANESGTTRVSFDLRLVPAACCPPEALRGPRRGDARGLKIGDYPALHVPAACRDAT